MDEMILLSTLLGMGEMDYLLGDQFRRTTVRKAESADNAGGGDNLKNGDRLWFVVAAKRAIEDVGMVSVSRIE
jgi:hypothetical protein